MENLTRLFWRSYADVDNRLYLLKRDILLFLDTHDIWLSLCRKCYDFSRLMRGDSCTNPEQIQHYTKEWKKLFFLIIKDLKMGKKAGKVLWNWFGVTNNWEKLWCNDEEEKRRADEWKDFFVWEVFYCSDRWSLDRLLRVQWLFRQWEEKAILNCKRKEMM